MSHGKNKHIKRDIISLGTLLVKRGWELNKIDTFIILYTSYFYNKSYFLFIQGCDASVLLNKISSIVTEQDPFPNINSLRGLDVMKGDTIPIILL